MVQKNVSSLNSEIAIQLKDKCVLGRLYFCCRADTLVKFVLS